MYVYIYIYVCIYIFINTDIYIHTNIGGVASPVALAEDAVEAHIVLALDNLFWEFGVSFRVWGSAFRGNPLIRKRPPP